jgi:nicotinamidase-related amidase
MDPKKTAVVLIEYQNDFTSEGGALHDAVKGVMEKTDMLSHTVETVQKAREMGAISVLLAIQQRQDLFTQYITTYRLSIETKESAVKLREESGEKRFSASHCCP